jgi:hypothetical protein
MIANMMGIEFSYKTLLGKVCGYDIKIFDENGK